MAARKGDSVLLVSLTVFVGYLYVTRRLQAVFDVLKGPAPGQPQPSSPGLMGALGDAAALAIKSQQKAGSGGPLDPSDPRWGYQSVPWSGTPPIAGGGFRVPTQGGSDPYTSDPRNLPPKWGRYTP